MPALTPASVQRIEALLRSRADRIRRGALPLKFIGVAPGPTWRAEAARTVDAAFQMFVPTSISQPLLDPVVVRELLADVHLTSFRTNVNLPIRAFLEEYTRPAPTAPIERKPPPSGFRANAGAPAGFRAAPRSGNLLISGTPSGARATPEVQSQATPEVPAQGQTRTTAERPGAASLRPMLELMKQGIIERHPAILEFLHSVLETVATFGPGDRFEFQNHVRDSPAMKRLIHLTYIFDLLIATMNNSKEFAFELQTHLYREINAKGINPFSTVDTFKGMMGLKNTTMFQGMKTISVFPAMTLLLARRFNNGLAPTDAQVEAITPGLSWADKKALQLSQDTSATENTGLLINMEEAIIADWNAGRPDNAAVGAMYCSRLYDQKAGEVKDAYPAGWVLPIGLRAMGAQGGVEHPFYEAMLAEIKRMESIKVTKKNLGAQAGGDDVGVQEVQVKNYHSSSYDDDWASLYETWNMAFILAEIPDLALIAPKLLAPAVMCARGDQYLFSRVHGLWMAICFLILKIADGRPQPSPPVANVAFAQLYGAINFQQGWLYMKKRPENKFKTKADFERYWQEAAPKLVGGATGYMRLAAHAFFGWTSRLV